MNQKKMKTDYKFLNRNSGCHPAKSTALPSGPDSIQKLHEDCTIELIRGIPVFIL